VSCSPQVSALNPHMSSPIAKHDGTNGLPAIVELLYALCSCYNIDALTTL
jgi:hypothetical protein